MEGTLESAVKKAVTSVVKGGGIGGERRCNRLARAAELVARRPVARPFPLEVPSRPEPPGAP